MSKDLLNCDLDTLMRHELNISIRNVANQMRIDELREKLNNCDNEYLKDSILRQINYLKSQIVR